MDIKLRFTNKKTNYQLNYKLDSNNTEFLQNQIQVYSLPLSELENIKNSSLFIFTKPNKNTTTSSLFLPYIYENAKLFLNNSPIDLNRIDLSKSNVLFKNSQKNSKENEVRQSSSLIQTFILLQTILSNSIINPLNGFTLKQENQYQLEEPINWIFQIHNFTAYLLYQQLNNRFKFRIQKQYTQNPYLIPNINLILPSSLKKNISRQQTQQQNLTREPPIQRLGNLQKPGLKEITVEPSLLNRINPFTKPPVSYYQGKEGEVYLGGGFMNMFSSKSNTKKSSSFLSKLPFMKPKMDKNRNETQNVKNIEDLINFIIGNRIYYLGENQRNYVFIRCLFQNNNRFIPIQVYLVPFQNMKNIYLFSKQNPLYNYIPSQFIGNFQLLNAAQIFFNKFGKLEPKNYQIKPTNTVERQERIIYQKETSQIKQTQIPIINQQIDKLERDIRIIKQNLVSNQFNLKEESRKGNYKTALKTQSRIQRMINEIENAQKQIIELQMKKQFILQQAQIPKYSY